MQEGEYTFVTLDEDNFAVNDAVVVDVEDDLSDIVMIDEDNMGCSDFITLSDDTVVLSDTDIQDVFSTDINDDDISFMI